MWQQKLFLPSLWLILMTRVFFVSFPFSFFFLLLLSPFFLSLLPFPRSGSPDVKQRRYGLKFWLGLDWIGLDGPQPAPGFSVHPPLPPFPLLHLSRLLPAFLPPSSALSLFYLGAGVGGGWSPCVLSPLPPPPTHSIRPHPTLVSDIKRCLNSCRCLQSPFCVFLIVYLAFFFFSFSWWCFISFCSFCSFFLFCEPK